jgi:hypothetical protein
MDGLPASFGQIENRQPPVTKPYSFIDPDAARIRTAMMKRTYSDLKRLFPFRYLASWCDKSGYPAHDQSPVATLLCRGLVVDLRIISAVNMALCR